MGMMEYLSDFSKDWVIKVDSYEQWTFMIEGDIVKGFDINLFCDDVNMCGGEVY